MKKNFCAIGLLLILLQPSLGLTASHDFASDDYVKAQKSDSFVRFDMKSTKLGLFTTNFSGYAKKFKVDGDLQKTSIGSGAFIEFNVKELDTDIDGRNEKMWELCLDSKNHPKIKIKLDQPIPLNGDSQDMPATLTLRGSDHPITLNVKVERKDNYLIFDISGELSIQELKIPDPSIAVASVNDKIIVKAHFTISEKQ